MRLHVAVTGGLVSRLRAVLGAWAYADAHAIELVVHWTMAQEIYDRWGGFRAKMRDVWDHPFPEIADGANKHWPKTIAQAKPDKSTGDISVRACHFDAFKPETWTHDIVHYFRKLVPSAETKGNMLEVPKPFNGLLIRDWLKQSGSVGVSWYAEKIKEHDCANWFLSCDSRSVSEQITELIPGVHECSKTYDYDRTGIIRQAADLYTLLGADYVLGANHSSYSELIALVRGAKRIGTHEKPGGLDVAGARYEDAWNQPK